MGDVTFRLTEDRERLENFIFDAAELCQGRMDTMARELIGETVTAETVLALARAALGVLEVDGESVTVWLASIDRTVGPWPAAVLRALIEEEER